MLSSVVFSFSSLSFLISASNACDAVGRASTFGSKTAYTNASGFSLRSFSALATAERSAFNLSLISSLSLSLASSASKSLISSFKASIFLSASDFGALPSGLFGTEGASPSFTPPVNSGTSLTAGSTPFTPPLNSGFSATGASPGFTPPSKSLGSSTLGTSFKPLIYSKVAL